MVYFQEISSLNLWRLINLAKKKLEKAKNMDRKQN
jgi:hypothetical protein